MDIDDLSKTGLVASYLEAMGYACCSELEAVRVIEENRIDISKLELPYGAHDFEEYKQEVLQRDVRAREIRNKENFNIDPWMRMY